MRFEAPVRLLIAAIPLALLIAHLVQRGRQRYVVRFSSLEMIDQVAPVRPGWRRHATAAVAVGGLIVLTLAFARPVVAVPVPRDQATITLAVDVSLSMGATDVEPSRIEAAREAAGRFLDLAPQSLRVGLVAFAGTALPVVGPEADRAAVQSSIDRLGLGEGTAVGEAIIASVDQITIDAPPEGVPAAIVLLSDGETTVGRSEAEAAAAAAEAGIPIYTIAFGTPRGVVTYRGERIPVPVNEGALQQVAEDTGGQFFRAATEAELRRVFDAVGSQIAFETEDREITDWFAVGGLLAVAVAAAASLRWFGRVI